MALRRCACCSTTDMELEGGSTVSACIAGGAVVAGAASPSSPASTAIGELVEIGVISSIMCSTRSTARSRCDGDDKSGDTDGTSAELPFVTDTEVPAFAREDPLFMLLSLLLLLLLLSYSA